jgi:hypothetical protein
MRTRSTVVMSLMLLSLAAPMALGQQLSDALRISQPGMQYNAHALGMGNAYSTVGYDVSALRFNPATMSVDPKLSFTVTANTDAYQSTSNYYGNKVGFDASNTSGGQLGLTMPFRVDSTRKLVIGLVFTQTKDFKSGFKYQGLNDGTRFAQFTQLLAQRMDPTASQLGLTFPVLDGSGNHIADQTILGSGLYESGNQLASGDQNFYSFGASIEPVHNVFVGASGSYTNGSYTSDFEINALDINDLYPVGVQTAPGNPATDGFESADYRIVRDQNYRGWDARFGMLVRLGDFLGLSTSFRLPSPQEVREATFTSGTSHFSGDRSIVVPTAVTNSKYDFKPPAEVTAGAMVNLWLVTGTAEATYVDYTGMELTSGGGDVPTRTAVNKRINEELAPVLNLNVGAEVRLPWTGFSARAGGIYQPSQYRADPARFARKTVTLGAGYNANDSAQIDLGYGYSWRGENEARQADPTTTDQSVASHTVLFTIRVAF